MINRHVASSSKSRARSASSDKIMNVDGLGEDVSGGAHRKVLRKALLTLMLCKQAVVKSSSNLGIRTLTLNRPKALNALNAEMIALMQPLLEGWEDSRTCNMVILKGEGRGFCAGGDVVGKQVSGTLHGKPS